MIGLICFKWNSTSKWRMTVANRVCGTLLLRHTTIVYFCGTLLWSAWGPALASKQFVPGLRG